MTPVHCNVLEPAQPALGDEIVDVGELCLPAMEHQEPAGRREYRILAGRLQNDLTAGAVENLDSLALYMGKKGSGRRKNGGIGLTDGKRIAADEARPSGQDFETLAALVRKGLAAWGNRNQRPANFDRTGA